jgi:N-acetylmuramoyl-L-alanine amidase
LSAAGVAAGPFESGQYCPNTEAAVYAFQLGRGLRADGCCDDQTWSALVEASWSLGDRLLYHRSPNLRGDDVAELQRRLGRLGFDAGRVDGIFGPLAEHALQEFQRNVGLHADGICGYETVHALHRLGERVAGPPVASIREGEQLRQAPRTLAGRRLVVGQLGSLGVVARAVAKALRQAGATVMTLDEPDGSAQAQATNRFAADVYLGLAPAAGPVSVAYYAVPGFESIGGRHLAELLYRHLATVAPVVAEGPQGMRLAVLRETRMPAVLCELGPVAEVVKATPRVVLGVVAAVTCWVETPVA